MKNIKILVWVLLLILSLSSCEQHNSNTKDNNFTKNNIQQDNNSTDNVENTETTKQSSGSTDNIKNLNNNNNNNMGNIQTAWVQNLDKVAVIKTNTWTIQIKLFTDLVPITTTNFIGLSNKWYYDGVIFHRVIKDFMIQWWDPEWTWMGGESIYWKTFEDEFNENLTNIKYSISMANAWANTNWSQFFINQNNNSHLNNKHSVFGQVIEWNEVVDKIAKTKTDWSNRPEKEIKIISIEIKEYNNWILKDYDFNLEDALKEIEEYKESLIETKKDLIIEKWSIVSVHYTWTLEDWTKFDSSYDRWTPLEFTAWIGSMIPWFDAWVLWMKIWDKKTLTLSPTEAYWERSEDNKQILTKEELKSFTDAWIVLEKWVKLPTQYWEFEILDVTDDNVTVDTNHSLAWKTLIFDIEIIDIK